MARLGGNKIWELFRTAADRADQRRAEPSDDRFARHNHRQWHRPQRRRRLRQQCHRITDFTSGTGKIAFSDKGFSLGLGTTATPQPLPVGLYSPKTNGTFNNATERFAYDTANGGLSYDAQGNTAGSSRELVATLTGHPALTGTDLFYVL